MATTEVATMKDITSDIVFPTVSQSSQELAVPPAPSAPMSNGLYQITTTQPIAQAEQTLVCSRLLVGDLLARAQQEAADLYPKMVGSAFQAGNTALVMSYGSSALQGVNDLIDIILNGTSNVKIPEMIALMKELNVSMRGLQHKYDLSDPKIREKYEHWKGGVGRFFGKAKTLVEMIMEDIQSIETQLDHTEDKLKDKADTVLRDIAWYDGLYVKNEQEIGQVIYAIAVMEMIRNRAIAEADKIMIGNDQLGDRGSEEKARLVQFAQTMDQKISAYKGRLFIAWATSPNVRNMRAVGEGVVGKLSDTIYTTIPTMKATLAQWRMLAETMEAGQLADLVNGSMNQWLVAFSAASATGVQQIAQSNATPALAPQTVAAMAKSIADQADAIVQAMQDGLTRRAELDRAILQGKAAINAANDKISSEFVQAYVDQAIKPDEVVRSVTA